MGLPATASDDGGVGQLSFDQSPAAPTMRRRHRLSTTHTLRRRRRAAGPPQQQQHQQQRRGQHAGPLLLLLSLLLLTLLPSATGFVPLLPSRFNTHNGPHHRPRLAASSTTTEQPPPPPQSTMMDAIIEPRRIEEMEGFRVVERWEGVAFVRAVDCMDGSSAHNGGSSSSLGSGRGSGGGDVMGGRRGRVLFLPGLDGSGCTIGPQVGIFMYGGGVCVCRFDLSDLRKGGWMGWVGVDG